MIGNERTDCYDELLGGNKDSKLSDYFEDILKWDTLFGSKQAELESQKASEKPKSKTPESLLKPETVVKESEGDDGYYDEFIADVPSASSSRSKKCDSKTFWKKGPSSHPASQEYIKDKPLHEVHNGQNRCAKGRNIKNQEDDITPPGDIKGNPQRRLTKQMESRMKKPLDSIQEENLNFKKSIKNTSKQEQGQKRNTIFSHAWSYKPPTTFVDSNTSRTQSGNPISNASTTPPAKTKVDEKHNASQQIDSKVETEYTKQNKPLPKLKTLILRDPGPSYQRVAKRDVFIKEDKPYESKGERTSDTKGLSTANKSNDEQRQRHKTIFNQVMSRNSPATFIDSNPFRPQPVDSKNAKATLPAGPESHEKHNALKQSDTKLEADQAKNKPKFEHSVKLLRNPGPPSDQQMTESDVHIVEDKPFEPRRENGSDTNSLSTVNKFNEEQRQQLKAIFDQLLSKNFKEFVDVLLTEPVDPISNAKTTHPAKTEIDEKHDATKQSDKKVESEYTKQNKPLPNLETSTKLLRDPGPSNQHQQLTNSDDQKKEDEFSEPSGEKQKDTKDLPTVSKSKNEQRQRRKTVFNQSMSKNLSTAVVDSNTLRCSRLQVAQTNIYQPPTAAFNHPIPPVVPCAYCDCPYPLNNQRINPNINIPLMNNAHNAPKPSDVMLDSNYTQKSPSSRKYEAPVKILRNPKPFF